MIYNEKETQVLNLLSKADFKNISKNEVMSFASKLSELRPEVATQIIQQFPQLADLIKNVAHEFKGAFDKFTASDDASISAVYDIFDKELDNANNSRSEYINLANKIQSDLSKCLDNPELTYEQQKEICEQEMEILNIVSKKDSEIREQEREVSQTADKKDSEKRHFNWDFIKGASAVALLLVGIGVTTLGGKFDIKIPIKK
jgi:hypothetical protein